jgi:hypothetical protein
MKEETKKIHHILFAFYKATMIPMIRWSFERAGFLLDLSGIRNPVQIDPNRALAQIAVPDVERDDSVIDPDQMRKTVDDMNAARKCVPTPKPSDFPISFTVSIQVTSGTCHLCGYEKEEEVSNEEE